MFAEKKQDRDNSTKISNLAQISSQWDHRSVEIKKKSMS
jgi:hypothetical protein